MALVNVPVKVGARAWRRCWLVMARRSSVLVVNESLSRRQRAVYLALALARGWGQYGTRTSPNPIFYSRRVWRFAAGRVHQLHGTGPWFEQWPGYNGARDVTILIADHRRSGLRCAILGTHLVSEGSKVPDGWRDLVRTTSKDTLRTLVQGLMADGCVVLLAGDMNIRDPFPLGPGFTWVRGDGIDKVGVGVPPGVELGHTAWRLVAAPTDHKHGVTARVTLNRKEP